jgi:hypothetical protein
MLSRTWAFMVAMALAPMAHAETKTVFWYAAHPDVRARVHSLCMDNPGEAMHTPDCLNAATAVEQAGIADVRRHIPVESLADLCARHPDWWRRAVGCPRSQQ